MFCPKCGSKALDGATFCQKCGANLIVDDTVQQAVTSTPIQQTQQQTHTVPSDMPKKKKLGKLPIILGAVALAIVVIIVIAMNWNGKMDYEATVRAHQPFDVTQGLSYTYGEVLDKYISSPDWEVRKSGDVNYVDISGKAKGTDNELVITIQVTADPSDADLAKIAPESVTIDGEKSPTQNDAVEFLLAMFLMYEEGYDDISDLFSETGARAAGSSSDHMARAESTDWGMAYAEKARELAVGDPMPLFNLIHLTSGDVPELVVDHSGYYISVFSWTDESLVPLMEDWPYGAGGNLGYEYLPGENVIRNRNNDQAGAIVYDAYRTVNEANEVVDLYYETLNTRFYKDANGNGRIDENEYIEEPLYYYGENEITAEEYASYQIPGDYQPITGDKSLGELMSLLDVEFETEQITDGKILYEGQPVAQLIGKVPEELFGILGDPTSGTSVDGTKYDGGVYFGYQGISLIMDDRTEMITWISGAPKFMEVNGVTLDKDRAGIISALGTPTREEEIPEDEYFDGRYIMEYVIEEDGIIVTVEMPDADSIAAKIMIAPSGDLMSEEEYEAFAGSEIGNQPSGNQQGGDQQTTGVYTLEDTSRKQSSSGNVYAAPLGFVTSSMVANVNILNPEKVRYGCKIQIITGKNALGMYESYTIDEDGMPGGTAYTVVDATVID